VWGVARLNAAGIGESVDWPVVRAGPPRKQILAGYMRFDLGGRMPERWHVPSRLEVFDYAWPMRRRAESDWAVVWRRSLL